MIIMQTWRGVYLLVYEFIIKYNMLHSCTRGGMYQLLGFISHWLQAQRLKHKGDDHLILNKSVGKEKKIKLDGNN